MSAIASLRPSLLGAGLSLAMLLVPGCHSACSGTHCTDAGAASDAALDAGARVVQADAACAAQSVHALRGPARPVDVVFVIDNSGSMAEEIASVRHNINQEFATIINQSGIDYRVIVISRYGLDNTGVCIEPPLAASSCGAGLAGTNSDRFFHYSQEIGSTDALCQVLATFDSPDEMGRAPNGWQAWLRPEAAKAFVLITDDSATCEYREGKTLVQIGGAGSDPFDDALTFHRALLAKSGAQFGVPPDVKYQFFSIVGTAPNDPPSEPYFPYQAVNDKTCDTAPTAGLSYQALSIITDALRYPVCEGRTFDAVFRVLARSVIQASQSDCVFQLPKAPDEQVIVLPEVNLVYQPSAAGSAPHRFGQVVSAAACKDDHSFYIREQIQLCPAACRVVQADLKPEVNILYGCMVIPQ